MKKRVLALVLCLIITFSMGVASVFACDDYGCGTKKCGVPTIPVKCCAFKYQCHQCGGCHTYCGDIDWTCPTWEWPECPEKSCCGWHPSWDWPIWNWPNWNWPDWDCPDVKPTCPTWEAPSCPTWEWPTCPSTEPEESTCPSSEEPSCPTWEWPTWPSWEWPTCPSTEPTEPSEPSEPTRPTCPSTEPTEPTEPERGTFQVTAENAVYDTLPHGGQIVGIDEGVEVSDLFYMGVDGTEYGPTTEAPVEVGTYVAFAFTKTEFRWAKYEITPVTVKFTLTNQEIWSGETIKNVWYENYYAEGFLSDITDFDPLSLKDREFTEEDVVIVVVDKNGNVLTDYSAPGVYTLRVIPKFADSAYNRNYQILESKIFDGVLVVKSKTNPETGDGKNVGLWTMSFALCVAGLAVLISKKRRA